MIKTSSKFVLAVFAVGLTTGGAYADPRKPECLSGAKPGGGFDVTCRLAANSLLETKAISTPMTVTYMEGGVGATAYNHVVGSQPDNPDMVVAVSLGSALLISQGKFGKHDENAVRWVGAVGTDYGVVAVRDDSPLKNLNDLIAALKANSADFPFAGGGAVGSQDWMKMSLVAKEAGVDAKTVRYAAMEGGGTAITSLLGGHVKVYAGDASEISPHLAAGKLRALAVLAPERLPGALAEVPTAKEQGHDIAWANWRGFYVGPKVSDADYEWWVNAFKTLVKTPEFEKERKARNLFAFDKFGPEFDTMVKESVGRLRTMSKEAGL